MTRDTKKTTSKEEEMYTKTIIYWTTLEKVLLRWPINKAKVNKGFFEEKFEGEKMIFNNFVKIIQNQRRVQMSKACL